MASTRIPSVDTSEVDEGEPMGDAPWEMTERPAAAFEKLASSMTRILSGCKKRCTAERLKGSKQACVDLISFATRGFPKGLIPLDRLSDACHIFLRHREHPSDPAASGTAADADYAPGFTARGCEDVPAADPSDPTFDEFMFNAGAILFTQFYRERNREIRLAYVCGYRDVLARAIAWSTTNLSDDNTVRAEALVGMLAWLVSRAPRADGDASAGGARSIRSPRLGRASQAASAARGASAFGGRSFGRSRSSAGAAAARPPADRHWRDDGAAAAGSADRGNAVSESSGVVDYTSGCKRREHLFDLDSEMVSLTVDPPSERDALRFAKRLRFDGGGANEDDFDDPSGSSMT